MCTERFRSRCESLDVALVVDAGLAKLEQLMRRVSPLVSPVTSQTLTIFRALHVRVV